MKVIRKTGEKTTFKQLETGECFIHENLIYLKIKVGEREFGWFFDENSPIQFDPNELVIMTKSCINVEELMM